MDLLAKKCVACGAGSKPIAEKEIKELIKVTSGWGLGPDSRNISREFKFKNFREAMGFVSGVSQLAESEGHHPDIHIFYNRVKLELSTHAVGGLTENDFILAAKINRLVF
mgnify:CR=1 FL=1